MRHYIFLIVGTLLLVCGIAFAESPYSDQVGAGYTVAENFLMQEYQYRVAAKTAAEKFHEANLYLLTLNDNLFFAKKAGNDAKVVELMAEYKEVMSDVEVYENEFHEFEALAQKTEDAFIELLDEGRKLGEVANEHSQTIIDGYDAVLTDVENIYLEVTTQDDVSVEVATEPAVEVVKEEPVVAEPVVEENVEPAAVEPVVEEVVSVANSSKDYYLDKTEEVLAVVPEDYVDYNLVVKVYSDSFELGYIVYEPKFVSLVKGKGIVEITGENTGIANLEFTDYELADVQFIANYLGVNLPGDKVSIKGTLLTNGNVDVYVLKKKLTFKPE